MDVILILVIVLVIVYLYSKFQKIYSLFDSLNIPGPKPLWILGNIHEFRDEDKLSMFKIWRKRYGDVYGFYEGFKPSIVVCDPELSRLILVKHFDKFHIRPVHTPFLYYPDEYSLLNVYGPKWKSQRTAVLSAFNSLPMSIVLERLCSSGKEMVHILSSTTPDQTEDFNISSIIDRYTVDAFSYGTFNHKVNSMTNDKAIIYQFMKVFNESSAADNPLSGLARVYDSLTPFLQIFDTKHKDIHTQHIQELRDLIEKRIQRDNKATPDNIIDFLLETTIPTNETNTNREKQRRNLTIEEIVAHLNSAIGGGFGTINSALSFVIHQLIVNPDVQETVFQEIKEHCGLFDDPTSQSINNLKYLDCVINESLRVLPCAPGVARQCTEDCVINGTQFKKGMVVRIMLCALYNDDKIYPDSKQFNPDRHTAEEKEKRHPSSFLPFGQGPRMCLGYKISTIIIKIAVVYILRHFILKPSQKTKDPLPTALRPMLVPKDGVFVKLQLRNNNTGN